MHAHVPDGPGSEIPNAAPFEGQVSRMVRPPPSRAEPEVPIKSFRHGRRLSRALNALRPPARRPIGPDMNLAHCSDGAGADHFDRAARSFHGMPLLAHLGDDTGFGGDLPHASRFVNGMGQRLLAVDMLPIAHGGDSGDGMNMVGCADHDCVQRLFHIKHFAEVAVTFSGGVFGERSRGIFIVDITQRDDVFIGQSVDIIGRAAACADEAKV